MIWKFILLSDEIEHMFATPVNTWDIFSKKKDTMR